MKRMFCLADASLCIARSGMRGVRSTVREISGCSAVLLETEKTAFFEVLPLVPFNGKEGDANNDLFILFF